MTILYDWWDYYYSSEEDYGGKLDSLVRKYNLTHVLCYSDDSNGINYMDKSPEYKQLYSDNYFYLYEYRNNN